MTRASILALAALTTLPALASTNPSTNDTAAPDPEPPTLRSIFAADLDPNNPLPEHPRPHLVRDSWLNLNGLWDYAITDAPGEGAAEPPGPPMEWHQHAICVPFPIESALSGVQQPLAPNQTLWYRRTFDARSLLNQLPTQPGRLLLHFGGVDYHATVYINGHQVGRHPGGYSPFTLDITDALRPDAAEQELIVRVTDPTDTSYQPRGKQTLNPHGIWYTAVTGIWQTVWLEAVPSARIDSCSADFLTRDSKVRLWPDGPGWRDGDRLRVTLRDDVEIVAMAIHGYDARIELNIPNPRLWSPDDPFLYDLTLELLRNDQVIDSVRSYFAARTVELKLAPDGFPRIHLNGQPIFLLGPLDQGWWPDGLYTAPTDEALRYDIEQTLAMGFNCARKHVKIEPQRWYYWADRLGLLVIQDMPSGDASIGPSDPDITRTSDSRIVFRREYTSMVRGLHHHPSIIAWVPFNEGWGQFNTNEFLQWAMDLDPTRLIDGPSGWTDRGTGHLIDAHVYPGPGMLPPQLPDEAAGIPARASFLGEFGGLGLTLPDHTWKLDGSWGYRSLPDAETLERDYAALIERLRPLQARGLAGAIYTQTTDVEIEVNGLLTYDRAVAKIPVERLAQINARAFLPPPMVRDIAATSEHAAQTWRFTTEAPAPDWAAPEFDDSAWPEAPGGFGTPGTPGTTVRTRWDTLTIWLRRSFDMPPSMNEVLIRESTHHPDKPESHILRLHHDEDVEVYLNGVLIHAATGYQTGYIDIPLSDEAVALLKPTGNTLAIRCTQTRGGQFIDAGLLVVIDPHALP